MTVEGVGSVLKSWIPEWIKIEKRSACGCEKLRQEMDLLGPDRVEADMERFVSHFMGQRRYLRKSLQLLPEAMLQAWVELAIKRACDKVRKQQAVLPEVPKPKPRARRG